MRERIRLRYTFYIAQAIEGLKKDVDTRDWVKPLHDLAKSPTIGYFDPVEREAQKTGTDCGDTGKYIEGLKKAGHWEHFDETMDSIWWGKIRPDLNKMQLLLSLRDRFFIEGNSIDDLNHWGDYEAVVRSNFIFAYIMKSVRTVGTLFEIHTAYLLGIPVFLIIPDEKTRDANSTLIDHVRKSGGEVFYNVKGAVNHVRTKYKIGE